MTSPKKKYTSAAERRVQAYLPPGMHAKFIKHARNSSMKESELLTEMVEQYFDELAAARKVPSLARN